MNTFLIQVFGCRHVLRLDEGSEIRVSDRGQPPARVKMLHFHSKTNMQSRLANLQQGGSAQSAAGVKCGAQHLGTALTMLADLWDRETCVKPISRAGENYDDVTMGAERLGCRRIWRENCRSRVRT